MTLRWRHWARHHLLAVLLGTTGLLAATLLWLGWLLLRQDRAVQQQHARERLEAAAAQVTATLTEGLRGVASALRAGVQMHPAARVAWLRAWTDSLGPGIVVLERAAHGTHHYPATGLLYRPASPSIVLTAPELELGEAMEFRSRNLDGAIDAYARSARSRDRCSRRRRCYGWGVHSGRVGVRTPRSRSMASWHDWTR